MIKIPKESFSQLGGSTLSRDSKFRARKKILTSAISATSLSTAPAATTLTESKKRARERLSNTHQRRHSHKQHCLPKKSLSDADFGNEKNLGYSSFGAYSNKRNPHANSPAAIAERKHKASVAAARSTAIQHQQPGGRFTSNRNRINSVPNLSQYVAPSQRTSLDVVVSKIPAPLPKAAARDSQIRAARREAIALRTLASQAGMGKTRVEFRSGRVAAEFSLTEVTSSWRRDNEAARNESSTNTNDTISRNVKSSTQPSVDKIEQCLRALSMMPHHLAVVVPTLRRAIYSETYAGIVVPETNHRVPAMAAPVAMESASLKGLPFYSVCSGLETSNKRLLSDLDALKEELEDLRKDRDAHAVMIKDSNGKIKELREKLIESEGRNKTLKKQLSNMREIASDTLEDNEGVTKRFVELDRQHIQLRTEHKTTTKELKNLRSAHSNVSDELTHAIRNCGRYVIVLYMLLYFGITFFSWLSCMSY